MFQNHYIEEWMRDVSMYPPLWVTLPTLPPPLGAGYINTNKEVWGIVLNNMRLIENSLCLHISM